MKPVTEFITRLHNAGKGALTLTEGDVIREIQADAFQAGYAKAAHDLMGIAAESQARTEMFVAKTDRIQTALDKN